MKHNINICVDIIIAVSLSDPPYIKVYSLATKGRSEV